MTTLLNLQNISNNGMYIKRGNVYVMQLLIQGRLFSLNMKCLFYLKLKRGRGVI